jgi:hypothetical protein
MQRCRQEPGNRHQTNLNYSKVVCVKNFRDTHTQRENREDDTEASRAKESNVKSECLDLWRSDIILSFREDFGNLKPGDWVIQNGANSMVGLAVVQIAARPWCHRWLCLLVRRLAPRQIITSLASVERESELTASQSSNSQAPLSFLA